MSGCLQQEQRLRYWLNKPVPVGEIIKKLGEKPYYLLAVTLLSGQADGAYDPGRIKSSLTKSNITRRHLLLALKVLNASNDLYLFQNDQLYIRDALLTVSTAKILQGLYDPRFRADLEHAGRANQLALQGVTAENTIAALQSRPYSAMVKPAGAVNHPLSF